MTISWTPARSHYLGEACVLFHGGLGRFRNTNALKRVASQVRRELNGRRASNALELSQFTCELLESEPEFNAGIGAKLQSDGVARLSSAGMLGSERRMAGLANCQAFSKPSKIVLNLLQNDSEVGRVLIGSEADRYAFQQGFQSEDPKTKHRVEQWRQSRKGRTGTVGALAFDRNREFAAFTSTGGLGGERPGRASDSFTPAGNYATSFGAVSCTGTGEDILDFGLATAVLTRVEDGMSLQEAVARSFMRAGQREFGLIGLDHRGHCIVHATDKDLAFGLVTQDALWVGYKAADWSRLTHKID